MFAAITNVAVISMRKLVHSRPVRLGCSKSSNEEVRKETLEYATQLIQYSARLMRRTISAIPEGVYEAEDALDGDGVTDAPVPIVVKLTIRGSNATVDFNGSSPQVSGPINAVEAITVSAVSYVFRCLIPGEVPASAGLMEPIKVIAPAGTVVNANPPASVAGGNVETSQRIVDVLFRHCRKRFRIAFPQRVRGQ
jgi:N-methylhydantoinase B